MTCKLTTIIIVLFFVSCNHSTKINEYSDSLNLDSLKLDTKISESLVDNLKTFNGSVLVLRIHEYDCSACVDFELDNLKKLPECLKNKTLILTAYTNQRALNILLNKHNVRNLVVNYDGEIPILQEKIGKPYYFLIDRNRNLSNFHISNINDMSTIIDYYKDLSRVVLNNDTATYTSNSFKIDKSSYNLGNIKKNSIHRIVFTLENLSNKPLLIENVIATCGCTTVKWERAPIKPVGKTEIVITYNAIAKGYFFKKIMILLSGDLGIQVVSIKGEVI